MEGRNDVSVVPPHQLPEQGLRTNSGPGLSLPSTFIFYFPAHLYSGIHTAAGSWSRAPFLPMLIAKACSCLNGRFQNTVLASWFRLLPPPPLPLHVLEWENPTTRASSSGHPQLPTSCKVTVQMLGKNYRTQWEKLPHALHSSLEGVCKRHSQGARLSPTVVARRQSLCWRGARPHPLARHEGFPLSPRPHFPAKLKLPLQLSCAPEKQQGSQES